MLIKTITRPICCTTKIAHIIIIEKFPTVLYGLFLKRCTLNNKTVGTLWWVGWVILTVLILWRHKCWFVVGSCAFNFVIFVMPLSQISFLLSLSITPDVRPLRLFVRKYATFRHGLAFRWAGNCLLMLVLHARTFFILHNYTHGVIEANIIFYFQISDMWSGIYMTAIEFLEGPKYRRLWRKERMKPPKN